MSSFSETETAELIEITRTVAKAEILPRFRALDVGDISSKSRADDLVTVADISAEAALVARLSARYPDAEFVGEEAGLNPEDRAKALSARLCFVIDPVDGTYNFVNGLAVFGTILAAVSEGETLFGLLYDPVLDDWVVARKGHGAWYGRPEGDLTRLKFPPTAPEEKLTGFLTISQFPEDEQPRMAKSLVGAGRVTSLICSCHEYRQVLIGRAGFVMNAYLNVWDHAAGSLAIREAGGVARLLDGRDYAPSLYEGRLLIARNDEVWAKYAARVSAQ